MKLLLNLLFSGIWLPNLTNQYSIALRNKSCLKLVYNDLMSQVTKTVSSVHDPPKRSIKSKVSLRMCGMKFKHGSNIAWRMSDNPLVK